MNEHRGHRNTRIASCGRSCSTEFYPSIRSGDCKLAKVHRRFENRVARRHADEPIVQVHRPSLATSITEGSRGSVPRRIVPHFYILIQYVTDGGQNYQLKTSCCVTANPPQAFCKLNYVLLKKNRPLRASLDGCWYCDLRLPLRPRSMISAHRKSPAIASPTSPANCAGSLVQAR